MSKQTTPIEYIGRLAVEAHHATERYYSHVEDAEGCGYVNDAPGSLHLTESCASMGEAKEKLREAIDSFESWPDKSHAMQSPAWSEIPPADGGEWWVKHGHGNPSLVSIGDPSGMCSTDPEKMTVKSAFGEELTLALYLGVHEAAGIPLWWAKATAPDGWESLMNTRIGVFCKHCGLPGENHSPALYNGAKRYCPSGFHWSQENTFTP